MACQKIVCGLLLLGGMAAFAPGAVAQTNAAVWDQLDQTPVRAAQASSPASAQPAATQSSAQNATQEGADPIGGVASLQGSASVTRSNKTSALALRDNIFKGDVLQTSVDGTLGITFDDETTFTLKPNSRITVDEFVYQEGGSGNAAVFNVLRGTVAFVAAEVAHTGNMKIETPTSTLGIRGTTGLVEVPAAGTAGTTGQVSIKLYPDADGRVGRIEVFGRDGGQLGVLTRGATGFAVRPGAPGAPQRFTAVPLQISAQEAERDRAFVRQTFSARTIGRQLNVERRNVLQQQRNQLPRNQLPRNQQQRNQLQPNQQRPGLERQNLQRQNLDRQNRLPGREQRPELQRLPGQQQLPRGRELPERRQLPGHAGQPDRLGQPPSPGRQQLPALEPRPGQPMQPGARPAFQHPPLQRPTFQRPAFQRPAFQRSAPRREKRRDER